ncbi:MAG: type II secretion system major pseudopilin GspG [Alphaproteobacteria bacterium]|nr:type II secretion system major pseudopilin GspG [Alphaproteobacteria bacterium]MBL6939897.1 type II secretion system major pseudopilin GspG [Alphaproteobacteria bacterium]MBL7099815.1 type II secretion system major pseudopilin GspG [Alphaproteobacteria bacterium]
MKRRAQEGYTLVELLVVLAILGLLATIATTQVLRYFASAKMSTAHAQVESLSSALDLYKLDVGHYPTSQEGLAALKTKPATAGNWNGPYVKPNTSLDDPWGHPYLYASPGRHGEFDLSSNGPDGEAGGNAEPPVRNW